MRIVQLTDQYLPSIGGTERHVANLSAALVERGHTVAVVTMGRTGLAEHERDPRGFDIIRIAAPELPVLRRLSQEPTRSVHPPMPLPGTRRAVARAIAAFDADVVHGHNWLTYPYLSTTDRVAVVHTLHDMSGVCPKMTLLDPAGQPCAGPSLRRCIPCSSSAFSGIGGLGVTLALRTSRRLHDRIDATVGVSDVVTQAQSWAFPHGVTTVPTFVPDHLTTLARDVGRPAFAPDGAYLLYVGALSIPKGIDIALEAYRSVRESHTGDVPDLLLIGVAKPDTPALDMPGVHVVFDVPHEQVMAAWRHAAGGLVPSRREAWGQVVAEALIAGCPLIVSEAVGLAPFVAEHDAGLVAAPNADAFAAAIQQMLRDQPGTLERAERGRVAGAQLTISSVVATLERIYAQAIDARRSERN